MNDYACIPVAYYNDFWLQSPSLKGIWHSPYGLSLIHIWLPTASS